MTVQDVRPVAPSESPAQGMAAVKFLTATGLFRANRARSSPPRRSSLRPLTRLCAGSNQTDVAWAGIAVVGPGGWP